MGIGKRRGLLLIRMVDLAGGRVMKRVVVEEGVIDALVEEEAFVVLV